MESLKNLEPGLPTIVGVDHSMGNPKAPADGVKAENMMGGGDSSYKTYTLSEVRKMVKNK